MVTKTVYYTLSYDTCLQGRDRTIQIFYRVDSWTLMWLGKQKKRNLLYVTPNNDIR